MFYIVRALQWNADSSPTSRFSSAHPGTQEARQAEENSRIILI
jgi:hypothetical protein